MLAVARTALGLQTELAPADKERMLRTSYTWRPLGELLLESGVLTTRELESALAEQRRTGRLIGEILVESGYISAFSLGRALATQHGVELRTGVTEPEPARTASGAPGPWRPLGKLLVEKAYLTRAELDEALAEQRASGGRRLLGEILVGSGFLSGVTLARALADQQGLELESGEIDVTTVLNTARPGQALYQVREVSYEPSYRAEPVLYKSVSLLEAADFAAELVEDREPDGVEIERTDGTATETVWTYSKTRAAAHAGSRRPLAETFGFDPTLWGIAS
jgi:hypothetical protein